MTFGGQTYKTVKIGEQIWFAENLNYEAEGSKCYENNPDYCVKYGRLYNWQTAMKVCPKGWHLPNNEEWDKLRRFVDGDTDSESPYASKAAGKMLKAVSGWNENGTDKYGFSALPGGYGSSDGGFHDAGYIGNWWSSSENDDDGYIAYYRYMIYYDEYVRRHGSDRSSLLSVRCVQD